MPETKSPAPRDVIYELETFEGELPPQATQGNKGSILKDQMDKVQADKSLHNKWHTIAKYRVHTAGTSAANTLRQRHGDTAAVDGWEFATRRVGDGDEKRTHLLVRFNPKAVKDGARAEFEQREEERKRKNAERLQAKRAADHAKGEQQSLPETEPIKTQGEKRG